PGGPVVPQQVHAAGEEPEHQESGDEGVERREEPAGFCGEGVGGLRPAEQDVVDEELDAEREHGLCRRDESGRCEGQYAHRPDRPGEPEEEGEVGEPEGPVGLRWLPHDIKGEGDGTATAVSDAHGISPVEGWTGLKPDPGLSFSSLLPYPCSIPSSCIIPLLRRPG